MSDRLPIPRLTHGATQPPRSRPPGDVAVHDMPGLPPVNFREVVGTLRRHLWLIVAVTALGVGVAGYLAYTAQPRYRAAATIRLANTRSELTSGLDKSVDTRFTPFTDPLLSQIEVLRSRGVARTVIEAAPVGLRVQTRGVPLRLLSAVRVDSTAAPDTLALAFDAQSFSVSDGRVQQRARYGGEVDVAGVRFGVLARPDRASGTLILRPMSAAVATLLGGLDAAARKFTDVVDVTFVGTDPVVAQRIVNAVVTSYQQVNAQTAQQQSRRRRQFLEEQLRQTDSLVAEAQQQLSEFRSSQQLFSAEARATTEQQGLLDLDVRRGELAADRQVYETLLARLRDGEPRQRSAALRALVSSPGLAANPVVVQLYQQLALYQDARDSLTTGQWAAPGTSPDVERLDTLISTTEARLQSAAESQIQALDARLGALDALRARNALALQRMPSTQVTEARLVQQVETAQRLADQLREEFQKARIAEAVEAGQVEILDLAATPGIPIGIGYPLKLLVGLLVGLALGGGAAFLLEHLNTAIRRREDLEAVLRVPGLAIIPQIVPNGRPGRLRVGPLVLPVPSRRSPRAASENGARLVTVSDFRSTGAEAFRTLRTNLIFSQAVQTLRTIVVTSPSPQDGKTTTAANLAVTFAQQGLRVLLVDCDLRRARLHTVFGVPREPGLTQLVLGHDTVGETVRATKVDGLFLLPAGTLPPNPSELLGGPQMRATLAALAQDWDIIILDTPPVHVAADALILATIAEGVILVLRAGQTERASAQDALARLTHVGARVVGAVLNDPDHQVPEYGGYARYNYQEVAAV